MRLSDMARRHEKKLISGVFLVMFILLYKQFSLVHIYFDDYAYYALSYAPSFPAAGNEYSLSQLMQFMGAHYIECNGRLLYFSFWLLLYWLGDLALVQFAAACIMTSVLYAAWMLCSLRMQSHQKVFMAMCVCVMYWLFDIVFLGQGIYWFAAFFLYVTPVGLLIAAALLYFKEVTVTPKKQIGIVLLIFASAWSQEQQMAATLFFAGLLALHSYVIRKERSWKAAAYLLPGIVAACVVLLSPGIQSRMTSANEDVNLLERLVESMRITIYMLGTASSWRINILLCFALMTLAGINLSTPRSKWRIVDCVHVLLGGIGVIAYGTQQQNIEMFFAHAETWNVIVVGVFCLASFFLQGVRFEVRVGNNTMLTVFVSAMSAIAVMSIIPLPPNRLLIFPYLIFLTLAAQAMGYVIGQKNVFKIGKAFVTGAFVVLLIIGIRNGMQIYRGYAANYPILCYNEYVIESTLSKPDDEYADKTIYLKEIPEPQYAGVMQYQEGYSHIKYYMNAFYGLPMDTEYFFSD